MEITKEKFIAYETVRQSGVTNMFAISIVCELSELIKEEVIEIMKTYDELNKKYPDVRK